MSASSQSRYFENAAVWNPTRYADIETERARNTIAWLPGDVHSVLDAGCGNGVLTNLLQGMDVRVGLDMSLTALQWLQAPGLQGDVAALPFPDGAFDAVITTEVIEHLPVDLYARGLDELARTARRYVIVSVPYCEDLEAFRVTCPACGCRFHRTYHMRRFERGDMEGLFAPERGLRLIRLEGIFPTRTSSFATLRHAIYTVRQQLGLERPNFRSNAVCPQCGYTKTASANADAKRANGPNMRVEVSKLVRKFEPSYLKPRWWLALYAR